MKRWIFSLCLVLASAMVGLSACGDQNPPATPTLTVSPLAITVTAGGPGQAFTATLANSTNDITWTLTGSGALSTTTGATTEYTPPATVTVQETATLTATAGTLTASATITIDPPPPGLSISPSALAINAGDPGRTFTATLAEGTDTISWTLTGNGSLSTDSGPTTDYTPPAMVAAQETATLTASAGSLSADALITINPGATITVSGRVLKFNGDPASGISVQIDDAAGVSLRTLTADVGPLAATDPGGNFSFAGVTPPYTLSVVPPVGEEVPQTWANVTRPDPIVVINPFSGAATFCPTPAPGTLNVTLTNPVGAGNTGRVLLVAEGISHLELASNVTSVSMPPGATAVTLTVPFDPSLCQPVINGRIIYLERNVSGAVVNTGTANVSVATGNTVNAQVTVLTGTTRSITGNVNFPVGTADGLVYLVLKVGGASIMIDAQLVTTVDPDYDIAAPELPGVEYRTMVLSGALAGLQIQWAHSGILTLPALDTDLQIPSLGETIAPAGAIGNNTTPDFRFVQITGTNLNYAYVLGGPAGSLWLGASQATTIPLPAGLPAPARLTAGTLIAPHNYAWAPLNSLRIRDGGDSDTMLDGRQVKKLYFGLFALFNPDVIGAGSYNLNPTYFNIP